MVLHILAKDFRRFWRETGAFVLVVAAWALQEAHPSYWINRNAESALPIGIFVLWFFLIIRVIHGESLVGDREFWQTRPYVWWQLMAAKTTFLLLALSLPLTCAQVYLLVSARVPWSAGVLPGLLWLQLEFAVFLMLPAVALAALTETIVQWILTLVVIGLLIPVVSWLPWSRLQASLAGTESLASWIGILTVAFAMAATIIMQYRNRHVLPARIVFAASVAFIPLMVVFAASSLGRSLAYPSNRGANPLQFAIARVRTPRYVEANLASSGSNYLEIPVGNVTVSPDTVVQVEGLRIFLTGQHGWHWISKWQNTNLMFNRMGQPEKFNTDLPSDIATKVGEGGAAARAELAIAVYRMSPERRIDTSAGRFSVPGDAVCAWPVQSRAGPFELRTLSCVEALRGPDLMITRIESAESTCPLGNDGGHVPPGHYATSYDWDSGTGPANFDLNPVHKFDLAMGYGTWYPAIPDTTQPNSNLSASVCRGTPLHLQTGTFVSRMRISVDLGEVDENDLHSYSDFPLTKWR